ncbi:YdhK family protein [Paenisporosarcina macmurdoensis]|uniref:YdhK family protein n=1 Tax=Paenisporosarcina macmurdoensis TaxID=212659 RepID=A0ABW1L500_9BACL
MKNTYRKILLVPTLVLALTACSDSSSEKDEMDDMNHENTDMESGSEENMDMNHNGSGEVPEDLKVEENPTFEVGSKAIIKNGHMEGMKGAEATIVLAFDTIAYAVSYTPTTGGEKVSNHKWVVHEEIEDAGDEPLEAGAEVILEADHMEGMDGAKAEIDSAEQTTVYMINFTPTTGGEEVTNHKWVTESELSAK